ncbi:MAG: hypothetical protein U0930_15310 [Pirellulales bacterium]
MRLFACLLCVLSTMTFAGCNTGADNNAVIEIKDYNPINDLRSGLEDIAKSGRLGSGFGSLRSAVTNLKKTDAAKGDAIEKELTELTELSDPAKVKAKAKEILGKL